MRKKINIICFMSVLILLPIIILNLNIRNSTTSFLGGYLGGLVAVGGVYWSTNKEIKYLKEEKKKAKNNSYKMILSFFEKKEQEIKQRTKDNLNLYSWAPISNDMGIELLSVKSYDRLIVAINSLKEEAIYPGIIEVLQEIELLNELNLHQRKKTIEKEQIIKLISEQAKQSLSEANPYLVKKVKEEVNTIIENILNLEDETIKKRLFNISLSEKKQQESFLEATEKIDMAFNNIKTQTNQPEEDIYIVLQAIMFFSIFEKINSIKFYQTYYYLYLLMGDIMSKNHKESKPETILKFDRLRTSILAINFYEEKNLKTLFQKLEINKKGIKKKLMLE